MDIIYKPKTMAWTFISDRLHCQNSFCLHAVCPLDELNRASESFEAQSWSSGTTVGDDDRASESSDFIFPLKNAVYHLNAHMYIAAIR